MVNYGNGKVYKIQPICEHNEDEVYIGSTTKKYLSQRMDTHRSGYKRWLAGRAGNVKSYWLFDKYNIENCRIVLIESVCANDKDELDSREAYHIQNIKCVNKNVFMRLKTLGRPEYAKQYNKIYLEEHR